MFSKFYRLLPMLVSVFVVGCSGSIEDLAVSVLYPYADVNKNYPVPAEAPEGYSQVFLDVISRDQNKNSIHVWLSQSKKSKKTLVYFHGNGENLASLLASDFLKALDTLGTNIVVMDYPAYGRSTGVPNQFNFIQAAVATVDFASKHFANTEIYIWGRSIGAAVAVQVAAEYKNFHGLILTSGWTRFIDIARELSGLAKQLRPDFIAQHGFDSVSRAPLVTQPLLYHHGVKDTLIPIKYGRILLSSFSNSKKITSHEFELRGHNDIFAEKKLWQDVRDFLSQPLL